ncbi:hypothetical protein EDD21DRAFT_375069 [Dissophora ornata]|nr:hypothetical protein EDD21DRAFT_375069 [Dissophora ornata]
MPALGYGSNGRREPKQDGIDPASSSLSVDVVHRAVRGAVGPSSFPNAKAQQQMYQKDRQKAFLMLQDGSQSAYSQHSPSQESSPTLPSPTASMYYPGNAHLISMYSQPSGVAASMAASVQYTPRSNYTPGFAGPSSVAGASSSARSDWSNSHRQKRQTPAASSSSSALALSPSSRSGPNAKATPLLLTRSHTATTTKTSTSSSTFKSAKSSKSALRTPNQFRDNSSDYFLHGTSAAYIDLIPVEDTPGISHASLHRVPSTLSSVSRVSKASKSSRGKGKERKVDQEEKDAYASLYGKMKAGGMGYGNSNSGGSSSRAYGGKGNIVGGGSALGRYHEEYEDDEEDDAEIRYL